MANKRRFKKIKKLNAKGQGLVEYLVLIAIMAAGTMAAVRYLNHTVSGKITSIVNTLQGNPSGVEYEKPPESVYKRKDMGDFLNGAASRDSK